MITFPYHDNYRGKYQGFPSLSPKKVSVRRSRIQTAATNVLDSYYYSRLYNNTISHTQDENYRKANMGYEPTHVEVFEQIADR